MATPASSSALTWVPGVVQSGATTARLLVPTSAAPNWAPFTRVAETIATAPRTAPPHGHEHEEVLTWVVEGYASSQFASDPVTPTPTNSVQLLSAPSKVTHRVSPAQGGTVRWLSLVLALPDSETGAPHLRSERAIESDVQPDGTAVRPLAGPGSKLPTRSGLMARGIRFAESGTTFQAVGRDRRAVLYVLAGRGEVDTQPVEVGEGVLVENVSGIAVHGRPGLRVLLASAPRGTPRRTSAEGSKST
jgi:redox-sensitive bicupin YhaK (pirin superfamily)